MLNYQILEKKPNVTIVKGNEAFAIKDLMAETYNKDMAILATPVLITKDYIARPDLISLAMYGTDEYADLLCKVNGLSNPFELNENMVLFCPATEYLSKYTGSSNTAHSQLINEKASISGNVNSNGTLKNKLGKFVKTSKITSTIGNQESTTQKAKNERRSPSEQTIGDKNFIIDKSLGIVIY